MSSTAASLLTPRDLASLCDLKEHGLSLLEIKISKVSPVLGQQIGAIGVPQGSRAICVIRDGEPIFNLEALTILEGDMVYLLTDDEATIRSLFSL